MIARVLVVLALLWCTHALADPPPSQPWQWRFFAFNGGLAINAFGCANQVRKTYAEIKACFVQHTGVDTEYTATVRIGATYYGQADGPTGEPGAGLVGASMYLCNAVPDCYVDVIGVDRSCPGGYTDVAGTCLPQCVNEVGKEADAEVSWVGAESDANPTTTCIGACVAKFVSGARFDITTATGTRYNSFKGITHLTDQACEETDRVGAMLGTARTVDSGTGTADGTGIGGVGSARGTGTGFLANDGLNLARVATNTARIADALAGGAGGTGGTPTGGGALCGGPSQPACNVSLDPGDLAASKSTMLTEQAAAATSVDGALQGQIDALGGSAPTFTPGGGRWLPSLSAFLPTPVCSLPFTVHLPGGIVADFNPLTPEVCGWVGYGREFLYWALTLWTLWAVWGAIFERRA